MEGVVKKDKENIKAIVDTEDGDSDNEDFDDPSKKKSMTVG